MVTRTLQRNTDAKPRRKRRSCRQNSGSPRQPWSNFSESSAIRMCLKRRFQRALSEVATHFAQTQDALAPKSGVGLDPLLLTGRGITLGAISVGSRADFEAMNRAIVMHRLRPVIDRAFPVCRAEGDIPPFRRSRAFRQGRDHTRLRSDRLARPRYQRFESIPLQQRVCKPSVPEGARTRFRVRRSLGFETGIGCVRTC
jgi:hypothetical protein